MPLYQKKPVEIQQFDGTTDSAKTLCDWVTANAPDFFRPALFTELPFELGTVRELILGVGQGRQAVYPQQFVALEAEGFRVYTPGEVATLYTPV